MTNTTYTVLIVEDLPTHRELYRHSLQTDPSCEYHILEAGSVRAGIELCQSSAIDAILLDYSLPDGDGLGFLTKLHAQSNGTSPPVVMVTGRGDERIAVQAIKLGAEDYLAKFDLTPARLHSALSGAIENARLRLQLQESIDRSKAALEERNQELDNFVHIVSHDLKAPLRAVSNLSQWIEEDLEGKVLADTQPQLKLLRSRVDRMVATIDGLLEYARIGRTDESIEPVYIAELLAEAIESLTPSPTSSSAEPHSWHITIAPDLPTLDTNRLLLFQVFTNLIGNAIVHHHRSDGSIQISCRECGDFYEFGVIDDGPGIAPENHIKIFTIFQAVNPQNRSDSTGIGLAIVKKIVETEGGTIRLESELGNGTAFYFTWPKRSN